MRAFFKAHPLSGFYTLAFVISWGAALIVIGGPGHMPGTPDETARLLPSAVLALLLGPSIAGITMTAIVDGRRGLRALWARMRAWRVDIRWYAVALLTAPVLATAALLSLRPFSPEFTPGIVASTSKGVLLMSALAAGLAAGIFEETGWTGFAIPFLRKRYAMLATGLIAGLLWGAWHYIAAFWGSGTSTRAWNLPLLVAQMTFYVLVLPAYRMLMVWVNDRTESLLIAMLMHASLTGTVLFILMPIAISAVHLMSWYFAFAAVLGVCVGFVALSNRV